MGRMLKVTRINNFMGGRIVAGIAWISCGWLALMATGCSTIPEKGYREDTAEFTVKSRALSGGARWPMVRNTGRGYSFPPQDGIVSYYGFEIGQMGARTANGEIFNPLRLTGASPNLPFNTLVRVIRVDTNQSVEVRINDRGPNAEERAKGRVIDISKAAAKKLGLLKKGIAPCRVEILEYPIVETTGPGGNG